jgi:hypothetical protein
MNKYTTARLASEFSSESFGFWLRGLRWVRAIVV